MTAKELILNLRMHQTHVSHTMSRIARHISTRGTRHDMGYINDIVKLIKQEHKHDEDVINKLTVENVKQHHIANTDHHLESFTHKNIGDMTIIQFTEMITDWMIQYREIAESAEGPSTFNNWVKQKCINYNIPKDVRRMIQNTYSELFH